MSDDNAETWTLTQAAAHIGAGSAASARVTLRRWGIPAIGRQAGRGGENLYNAQAVRDAKAGRPGQGARTDLETRRTDMATTYTNTQLYDAQRRGARITSDIGATKFSITANLTWESRYDGDPEPWTMYDENGNEQYRWAGRDCFPVWPKEGEPPFRQPSMWNPGGVLDRKDPTA